ncbi:PLAT domain-containing protein 1 [Vitis vinifera]|eukprot:XP_002277128.2 PREDICTED: PLAT domain-containing protein 1 [Vitis vinifera]
MQSITLLYIKRALPFTNQISKFECIDWEMEIEKRSGQLCLFILVIVLSYSSPGNSNSDNCVYALYVKTGSVPKAGTDSNISITLSDPGGKSVRVSDLESWGLMGSNHNYYERGNMDVFSGRGPCIGAPICRLNLTSDGSGEHHGWYCDYVEVTATGPHRPCGQTIFYVDQWLASDAPPYQLTAVVDGCRLENIAAKSGRLVLRNSLGSASM